MQEVLQHVDRPKNSREFGKRFTALLRDQGLASDQAAVDFMEGAVSLSYVGQMRRGKVPAYEVARLLKHYFGAAANPLLELSAPELADSRPSLPYGLQPLRPNDTSIASAGSAPANVFGGSEAFGGDRSNWTQVAIEQGADVSYQVKGDCLHPYIRRGDEVAIKRNTSPKAGDIVLVVGPDDTATLKVWRQKNGKTWLGTVDEERFPPIPMSDDYQVLGIVVSILSPHAPHID